MTTTCSDGIDTGFVALGYAKVAFLGVVQSITELLPVSSTAHMRVVPALFGWNDPGSAFSAAMQMAALVAIVSYFWSDVKSIAMNVISGLVRRDFHSPNVRLFFGMIVATIPIGIAGLLLSRILNACESPLRSLNVIGAACLGMGLLLAISEIYATHRRKLESPNLLDSLIIGIAQVGALIPGVSRSGSTLTAAMFLNLKRQDAARYSFLLGLPAITLAGAKELHVLYQAHLSAYGWSVLGVVVLCGALSAFVAIWTLSRIMERFSSWPFAIYRVVLGSTILGLVYAGAYT